MFNSRVLTSVLVLAAAVVPASATTIYCNANCGTNTEAAFISATAGLFFGSGLEDFTPDVTSTATSGLIDADGITGLDFLGYSNTTPIKLTVAGGVLGPAATFTSSILGAQFPTGLVYAFAANVSSVSGAADPCVEPISSIGDFGTGNCDHTLSVPASTEVFFGVISDTALDTPLPGVFLGQLLGNSLAINNFEIGQQPPAEASEVATFLMIGTGLLSLGLFRRFRPRAAH